MGIRGIGRVPEMPFQIDPPFISEGNVFLQKKRPHNAAAEMRGSSEFPLTVHNPMRRQVVPLKSL